MVNPIILVKATDSKKSEEIITKIRKIPLEESKDELGYIYHIKTKYYETDVTLYPFSGELSDVASDILKQIEGILIYFDANERQFLEKLPGYAGFVEENDIEFGILLCDELFEDINKGVTYKEAKKFCNMLDVIELEPTKAEDEDDDPDNVTGVEELVQAMQNFIWSNVDIDKKNGPEDDEDPDNLTDERQIEDELKGFERLLTQVMQFRPNTNSWTRNERLAYAQDFAEVFDDLIGDDAD